MRLFHARFPFDKFTDGKFRWKLNIDGVPFQIYIVRERVPNPTPAIIDATVLVPPDEWFTYRLTRLGKKSVGELEAEERTDLISIGLPEQDLAESDTIIGTVQIADEQHTQTVRYNSFRGSDDWAFGDPYVPKSLFKDLYPKSLLFVVRWID